MLYHVTVTVQKQYLVPTLLDDKYQCCWRIQTTIDYQFFSPGSPLGHKILVELMAWWIDLWHFKFIIQTIKTIIKIWHHQPVTSWVICIFCLPMPLTTCPAKHGRRAGPAALHASLNPDYRNQTLALNWQVMFIFISFFLKIIGTRLAHIYIICILNNTIYIYIHMFARERHFLVFLVDTRIVFVLQIEVLFQSRKAYPGVLDSKSVRIP